MEERRIKTGSGS